MCFRFYWPVFCNQAVNHMFAAVVRDHIRKYLLAIAYFLLWASPGRRSLCYWSEQILISLFLTLCLCSLTSSSTSENLLESSSLIITEVCSVVHTILPSTRCYIPVTRRVCCLDTTVSSAASIRAHVAHLTCCWSFPALIIQWERSETFCVEVLEFSINRNLLFPCHWFSFRWHKRLEIWQNFNVHSRKQCKEIVNISSCLFLLRWSIMCFFHGPVILKHSKNVLSFWKKYMHQGK